MFSLGVARHGPEVAIDRGIVCNAEFTCTKGADKSKVQILKEESSDLAYKVTLIYRGMRDGRPDWFIYINDKLPIFGGSSLSFGGSKAFVFKPIGKELIEVQETDENATESLWIDMSEKECYEVYSSLPVVSDAIQALVEKGKFFKTADDKEVKKIFYGNDVGVFLYARNKEWKTDIYYAKDAEEFSKCESKMLRQCRCETGDSVWEIKLPTETKTSTLEFPQGNVPNSGHGKKTSFNAIKLKGISL